MLLPKSGKHPIRWTLGWDHHNGYRVVKLKTQTYLVHRLVAETFIPNPHNKPQVDHIDRNRANNNICNLRWVTSHENMLNTPVHEKAVLLREGFRDETTFIQSRRKLYYDNNRERILNKCKEYNKSPAKKKANKKYNHKRSATHKYLKFNDGTSVWVPNDEAVYLLAQPVSLRKVPARILKIRQSRRH